MAIPQQCDPFHQTQPSVAPLSAANSSLSSPRHQTHSEPPSKRACVLAASIAAMVPLADFCNHSYTRSLSHFEFSRGRQGGCDCVSLVCDNDVKAGEEVLICYGAKTTAQLLCFYGFEMGAPLPCDVLHVALVMPTLTASPNNAAPDVCGCECTSCYAADDARLEFLSKCSLRISDDHGIACSLLLPLASSASHSSTPASATSSASTAIAHSPSHLSPLNSSISHYHIAQSQPCVDIPTAVASYISAIRCSPCVYSGDACSGCKPRTDIAAHDTTCSSSSLTDCDGRAEEAEWLQVNPFID
jgi:hypothetical protein